MMINKNYKTIIVLLVCTLAFLDMNAQSKLYPQHFDLSEVTLTGGPFRQSMELNDELLLKYDMNRFVTGFIVSAGLDRQDGKYKNWSAVYPVFSNWGWAFMAGHYLSALSIAYAACPDDEMKTRLGTRLDNELKILNDCQEARNSEELMYGYLSAVEVSYESWSRFYGGDIETYFNEGNFYTMHKNLNGLRDSWVYAGREQGREMFRKMCDWLVRIISNASDSQLQHVLDAEHGGVNESLADAYHLFGDAKYLNAAKRLCHKTMVDNMQTLNTTLLDGLHANTQVPKYTGFERVYQVATENGQTDVDRYRTAAHNFFTDVHQNRTVCIGGNSISEHFLAAGNCSQYINNLEGPETCNSHNMLKLEETLFDETHDAQYVDAYEATMWNHILATQDPNTGGYVYFTPLRPQAYRVYSQVNQGMWCCVGTGMENHGKYGHFVYTHSEDDQVLYVNLFTASKLSSQNFAVTQETDFPYVPSTKITVEKAGNYTIAIRHPHWAGDAYSISVNGAAANVSVRKGVAKYVNIKRNWRVGDVIDVNLPMELRYEECPNYGSFVAFKYGPILLAAQTTATSPADAEKTGLTYEELPNQYADDSRWGHSEGSVESQLSLTSSPLLICDRSAVLDSIHPTSEPLDFTININPDYGRGHWTQLHLRPFYKVQNCRYVIYWYQQNREDYENSDIAREDAERMRMEARTVDFVGTGEQQSESTHQARYSSDSNSGYNYERYRDAQSGGFVEYKLANPDGIADGLSIMCRFFNLDNGRTCTIYVDGEPITYFVAPRLYKNQDGNGFYNVEFPIPSHLMINAQGQAKKEITFRISATGTMIPGLYYLRLLKDYEDKSYRYVAREWIACDYSRVAPDKFSYDDDANTITINAGTGQNNVCLRLDDPNTDYCVDGKNKMLIVKGKGLLIGEGNSYLWWLNGKNEASSIPPTQIVTAPDRETIFAWDLSTTGIDENCRGEWWNISSGLTCFGLTSKTGISRISYIGFAPSVDDFIDAMSVKAINDDADNGPVDVMDVSGRVVRCGVTSKDGITSLPHGIYIVGGKKVVL